MSVSYFTHFVASPQADGYRNHRTWI